MFSPLTTTDVGAPTINSVIRCNPSSAQAMMSALDISATAGCMRPGAKKVRVTRVPLPESVLRKRTAAKLPVAAHSSSSVWAAGAAMTVAAKVWIPVAGCRS